MAANALDNAEARTTLLGLIGTSENEPPASP